MEKVDEKFEESLQTKLDKIKNIFGNEESAAKPSKQESLAVESEAPVFQQQ